MTYKTQPPYQNVIGEVMHEDICNTHEGGPCNCDWSAADQKLRGEIVPLITHALATTEGQP